MAKCLIFRGICVMNRRIGKVCRIGTKEPALKSR